MFFIIHSLFSKIVIFLGIREENFVTREYLAPSRPYQKNSKTWCVQRKKQVTVDSLIFYLCRDPGVFLIFALQTTMICITAYVMQQFERRPKWDVPKISVNGMCVQSRE